MDGLSDVVPIVLEYALGTTVLKANLAALGSADVSFPVVRRTVLVQHPKIPLMVVSSRKMAEKGDLERSMETVQVIMELSVNKGVMKAKAMKE